MALSGLDIYKLLPKTNCRECGFATCLAFAMQLAKKAVSIDKCPYLSRQAKEILEASSQPQIKLVTIAEGDNKLQVGNETVLFRHEEKFFNPCGIGIIIGDNLPAEEVKKKISVINELKFERVGQVLNIDLVAIEYLKNKDNFLKAVEIVLTNTKLGIVLICKDLEILKQALQLSRERRPLIYHAVAENMLDISKIALEFKVPLVVTEPDLGKLAEFTKTLNSQGVNDLVLDTGKKNIADKLWDLTQIRRQALKKSNRNLGYPVITIVDNNDPYEEIIEASTYAAKYASIVLLRGSQPWQILALLTLRQNIYTDPQKPLQIEPKLYLVGAVNNKSPVLVTTNFSLSYFTVLGEVEASKIPAYIISVDTEGMSVLTAWAAEKFTPEKISESIEKSAVKDQIAHKKIIIPGYVAMISGDLEDKSGWQVIVGPKEAAGIPSFLKNLPL
ncbi:MAG: acetyl-CoA decarbonylase/synthase complex subunit gamma [Candidatus Omnitrophota bacterium]